MGIWEQLGPGRLGAATAAAWPGGRRRQAATVAISLARRARDAGRTVVVTTTTHILRHPGLLPGGGADAGALAAALEGTAVTVGTVLRGQASGAGTWRSAGPADVVLVEADGAKRLPPSRPRRSTSR
ncbi:MAG: hypothetical protein ACLRWQ_01530 [Flavonifractor plautii]